MFIGKHWIAADMPAEADDEKLKYTVGRPLADPGDDFGARCNLEARAKLLRDLAGKNRRLRHKLLADIDTSARQLPTGGVGLAQQKDAAIVHDRRLQADLEHLYRP